MNMVAFCRRNQYAVYLLTVALFVAGLVALFELPSNIYPELNFPRVVIITHAGDLAPDLMLVEVTRPLEEATSTVQGVYRVRSKTIRGSSEISVWFRADMDMQYALQLVQGAVNESRSGLPADTEIEVQRVTPAVFPVISLILNGDVPPADLRDYAWYILRPLFTRAPGAGPVEVQASDTREVSVVADPSAVLARKISLVDVADELRAQNDITSIGRLPKDYQQYLALAGSPFHNLDDVRNAVVAVENGQPIPLRDMATVRDGVADRLTLISGNGKPAALINIPRQIGGNILQLAAAVKQVVANPGSALPPTLHLSVVYDLAEFVSESMGSVRDAILIGAALAILILGFFLRDTRTTLIAATSLPLSVIGTFFFLRLFGGTLNLMSLGGLAIAIGLIIDDAVVIIENIYRHLGLGESPALAAESGTRELIGPVVGSTATTLVVFLPLGLLTGVVGEFFRALCLTLSISVLLSLVIALTLVPLLSQRFLSAKARHSGAEKFMAPVNRAYERAVRWSLRRRTVVIAAALISILATVGIYRFLQTGFLPEMDEGGFVLDYLTPPGTSLQQTDAIVRGIETKVAAIPEVAAFSRRTGAELGLYATEQNKGDILVKLKPRSQRRRGTEEIIDDLRAQIAKTTPGITVEFAQLLQDMIGDLEGTPEPIEVKLFGNDMATLESVANVVGPQIQTIPGIVDFVGVQKGNPEIVFTVDAGAAGRDGMTVEQVSQQVKAGLLGDTQTSLRNADRTIPIRVRFPDEFRYNYDNVVQFPLVTPGRQIVPLASIANVQKVQGESRLQRENQRLMITLTARLENRDLGSAVRDVQNLMQHAALPVGTTYEIGGQYESQQQSFRELLFVLGLGLAAVFAVLVIQFRSFGPALIILSAAPLSLLGVFGMLWATGTALNVSSFMGIILTTGLVVKNGIILFEYVHRLQEEGAAGSPGSLREALVAAGKIRIRPILMTTLATTFGLLPLALGLGAGAELQRPLALAVIGGLLLSTFGTLVLMPVLYSFTQADTKSS